MTSAWTAELEPEEAQPARPLTQTRSQPLTRQRAVADRRSAAYTQAAVSSESEAVRNAPPGTRNDQLNRSAFALGQFVAGGLLDEKAAIAELTDAALASGLAKVETQKTINSGLSKGKAEPRRLPDPEPSSRMAPNHDEPPPGRFDDDAPDASPEESEPALAASPASPPLTPANVVAVWRLDGPLVRIPTGLAALDKACRGGLPVPWRLYIIGAPSAGKTLLQVATADHMARAAAEAGACVGILAVDEEPEDITIRLLQIAGFTVAEAEARDPEVLRQMGAALEGLAIRLYDATWTIETAAADLAAWAAQQRRHGVLFVDSLQTARSSAGAGTTARDGVEANVRATRWAATTHRLLVVATSEANRASYRNDDAAKDTNDLAAGAETRAIEFGAQTLLMLRTPKDEPDTIHVRIAKNRRAFVGEFWLRLDRERHRVTECDDPNADPNRVATREHEQRQGVKASVLFDAEHLASVLRCHPDGLGELALRAELRTQGFTWGVNRLLAAKAALAAGHKGCRLAEVSEGPGKRKLSRLETFTEERAAE